ncbi:MAG: hypothetical protein GTN69_00090 [Armatimonadetes bacterium]|nr:hypothetical protein [Armatimonadota bacterium]NIO74312.1 hypothetical protein [Armatimonadota bacterium]NIO95519.1 hypothetical protein [Armatimonadota bacterium]
MGDLIDQISNELTKMSDEQLNAVIRKVDEHGLNKQTEPLDFDKAMEVLRMMRDVIQGAVDSAFFAGLPVKVQREVLPILQSIAAGLSGIPNQSTAIATFVAHVDQLHAWVWRNRVAERTTRILRFKEKMEELTRLTAAAQQQNSELQKMIRQAGDIQTLVKKSHDAANGAAEAYQEVKNARQQAGQSAQETGDAQTQATERSTQIDALLGQAKSSRQQISTFEEDLKALYSDAQDFRERIAKTEKQAQIMITETRESAEESIKNNNDRIESLIERLESDEKRIEDALEKATGASLFDSFNTRKDQISKGKWLWAGAAMLLGIGTIALVAFLSFTCKELAPLFYFKLGLALPIAGLIWFCIAQYNRERRLEEEYAFKSNISLSLVPYKGLVEDALDTSQRASKDKYAQFLVDSVDNVFRPPADHRAEPDLSVLKGFNMEQLEKLAQIVHVVWQGKK